MLRTYKIFSVAIAILLFISSSGLTMDMHFCQGDFQRLNLFGKAKTCAEVMQSSKKCHSKTKGHQSCGIDGEHKGCCDNKSFDLDMDFDSGEASPTVMTDAQIQFVKAYVSSYFINLTSTPTLHNYLKYYPPPLKRDISILFQTFLL